MSVATPSVLRRLSSSPESPSAHRTFATRKATEEAPASGSIAATLTGALRWVCAIAPLYAATSGLGNAVDVAHDAGLVRTLGRHGGGLFHGPDLLVAALGAWLPLGTLAFRAALPTAALTAVFGVLVFEIARAVVRSADVLPVGEAKTTAFLRTRRASAAVLATLASLVTTLSPATQFEAGGAGSALLGVILCIAPLYVVAFWPTDTSAQERRGLAFWFLIALATAQEPWMGPTAWLIAALAVPRARTCTLHPTWASAVAALAGLTPMVVAVSDSRREGLRVDWFSLVLGDRGMAPRVGVWPFLRAELGIPLLALGIVGMAMLAYRKRTARPLAAGLGVAFGGALVSLRYGASVGPDRFGAGALLASMVCAVGSAAALSFAVSWVASAPIPFARASATMMSMLFAIAPLKVLDDSQTRVALRGDAAAHLWEEWAFDDVPARALALVSDPRVYTRMRAARAAQTMPRDLDVLPTFALEAPSARMVIAKEPKLAPLLRDMLLTGAPLELSLSELSSARPLLLEFNPKWERALAKHLVPAGLFMRFESEPRGMSERRSALERQAPLRDRLASTIMPNKDPELVRLTVRALRQRSIVAALTGERDAVSRALDDLRMFAPRDPILEELVRRVVLSKGLIEVSDLDPLR